MRRILTFIQSPPRIPELVFAAVLVWLFATGEGWSVLLADGDTGWHIRNGERIIDTGVVPHSDVFAFGSAGRPWFSWEWMSDVIFALLFRSGGLKAVTVFCGITIAFSVSVLFRHMIGRLVGVCIALPVALLSVGASSVHYLARPHVVGLVFFAVTAWIIDRDRASPGHINLVLPLLLFLWVNCHGSFLAGLALIGLRFIDQVIQWLDSRDHAHWRHLKRQAAVLAISCAATFCNPYGWRLHAHSIEYLRSSWIQATVEEFQSPRFRSESMLQYEVLLFAGLAALPSFIRRKEVYPVCVILLWAHESLASVRHVPLYCLAASPFIAAWLQDAWSRGLRRSRKTSFLATFDAINSTWKPWSSGYTIWPLILCICIAATAARRFSADERVNFPANKFPVKLVDGNLPRLSAGGSPVKVFSSDQWSDYLIFRFHPAVRVFFDGRSDFFGPWRGREYQKLMAGSLDSASMLERENVDLALLPKNWALSGILRTNSQWWIADEDDQAVLFVHGKPKTSVDPNQEPLHSR